jgi:hypothetical protein
MLTNGEPSKQGRASAAAAGVAERGTTGVMRSFCPVDRLRLFVHSDIFFERNGASARVGIWWIAVRE